MRKLIMAISLMSMLAGPMIAQDYYIVAIDKPALSTVAKVAGMVTCAAVMFSGASQNSWTGGVQSTVGLAGFVYIGYKWGKK